MYQQLSSDGTFTKPANSKLLYGTMSLVRAVIVYDCQSLLSRAITIAIRYSAVRRQGQLKPRYVKVASSWNSHKSFLYNQSCSSSLYLSLNHLSSLNTKMLFTRNILLTELRENRIENKIFFITERNKPKFT